MFCSSCGHEVPDGSAFCDKCGKPIQTTDNNNHAEYQQQANNSLQSSQVAQKAKNAVESLNLTNRQLIVSGIAALATLLFLFHFNLYNIMAGVLLTYLCVRKYSFDSKPMALAYTLFALRFLWSDVLSFWRLIFRSIHIYSSLLSWIVQLILFACVFLYWRLAIGKSKNKEMESSLVLLGTALSALYALAQCLYTLRFGFRSSVSNLAWLLILLVYILQFIADKQTMVYIGHVISGEKPILAQNSETEDDYVRGNTQPNRSTVIETEHPNDGYLDSTIENNPVENEPAEDEAPVETSIDDQQGELGFLSLNEFIIDEKVTALGFTNSYKVYNMSGALIGYVQQAEISNGAKAAQVIGGTGTQLLQKFRLNILSADGRQLGAIYREGGALTSIFVEDASGVILREMKLRFGSLKDNNDNFICKIALSGLTKYNLKDARGNSLAVIEHKWNGAKSLFTTADKYHVILSPSLSGDMRQIIGSVVVASDMLSGDR